MKIVDGGVSDARVEGQPGDKTPEELAAPRRQRQRRMWVLMNEVGAHRRRSAEG